MWADIAVSKNNGGEELKKRPVVIFVIWFSLSYYLSKDAYNFVVWGSM